MLKLPWRAARLQTRSLATLRSLFSEGMAMKPQSKVRTVSCVSWSEGGWAHSMANLPLIFGTLNFEARSASIRRLPAPFLPMTYKRTEMVLAGQSKAQIIEGIKTFIKQKLLLL